MTVYKHPDFDWSAYARASQDWPPRPLLLKALSLAGDGQGRQAIEIGCSSGRDAIAMAQAGWQVLAIDINADACQALEDRLPADLRPQITVKQGDITREILPQAALIHAGYTLPFTGDQQAVWQHVTAALAPAGLFVGQFFGPSDDWAQLVEVTPMDKVTLGHMLQGWRRLHYEEKLLTASALITQDKQWHLFNLIVTRATAYGTVAEAQSR